MLSWRFQVILMDVGMSKGSRPSRSCVPGSIRKTDTLPGLDTIQEVEGENLTRILPL